MNKLIYTVTEAAYLLNCSAAKVYKLIKAGKLPYGKMAMPIFFIWKILEIMPGQVLPDKA